MSGLRLALVVGGVGIHVNGAVLKALENIGTSAQRLGGLFSDDGQVALVKAELVVVVVVLALVAIVVERSNGHSQLINQGSVNLGCYNTHAVVAGFLNAGDVIGRLASLNTNSRIVVNVLGDQIGQSGTGSLSFHLREVPAVLIANGQEEVLYGCVCVQGEAPLRSSVSNRQSGGLSIAAVAAHGCNIVNDLLSKLHTAVVDSVPECLLLILSPVGEVSVILTSLSDQSRQGAHAVAVLVHTLDGAGVEGNGAVIGGVGKYVHGEDDVVDVCGGAVGELNVVAHGHIVVNGAVVVLGDSDVSGTVVGVVGAVVGASLALNAAEHGVGYAVYGEQVHLSHVGHALVVCICCEEGRELALESSSSGYQGAVIAGAGLYAFSSVRASSGFGCAGRCGASGAGSIIAAASQKTDAHANSQKQRKQLGLVFHVKNSSLKILNING